MIIKYIQYCLWSYYKRFWVIYKVKYFCVYCIRLSDGSQHLKSIAQKQFGFLHENDLQPTRPILLMEHPQVLMECLGRARHSKQIMSTIVQNWGHHYSFSTCYILLATIYYGLFNLYYCQFYFWYIFHCCFLRDWF